MGGCGECLAKFGLISFNIIFLLSGIAVLGVGIWVKVDKNVVNMQNLVQLDSDDKALDTAGWVLIGFGSFVLIISAFGFFAACTQKKFFIVMYIFFLVVVFAGEFAGGISVAVFKGKIDDELPKLLDGTLHNHYKEGSNIGAKAWDYVQVWLKCCGANGISDYTDTNFTTPGLHVPKTCCKLENGDPENPKPTNSTACQTEAKNGTKPFKFLNTEGCLEKFEKEIKSHLALVIGVAVGIAMLQILGIVLAICVCKKKRDDKIA